MGTYNFLITEFSGDFEGGYISSGFKLVGEKYPY